MEIAKGEGAHHKISALSSCWVGLVLSDNTAPEMQKKVTSGVVGKTKIT